MDNLPASTEEDDLPDPRLLRMFDLIYSTRSVTRAAERLGQKQPTISIWLAKLRRQAGPEAASRGRPRSTWPIADSAAGFERAGP
jgi:hypothetical protein